MSRVPAWCGTLALGAFYLAACDTDAVSRASNDAKPQRQGAALTREPISPLPEPEEIDPREVSLGRSLFHDTRLSSDGSLSCRSCHELLEGGDDGQAHSVGVGGERSLVNAPTVFNASLNIAQFWDGRAATLEEQVNGPVSHPFEMNSSWEEVMRKLRADKDLMKRFAELYPEGLEPESVRRAIAQFERTLITAGSPFDRWLEHEPDSLGKEALEGYRLFQSLGCTACHQGANVGGNMYQRFGILGDYFADRGNVTEADYGRFNVTQKEEDRFVFRVPSLRQVVATAPYFHDGSTDSLEEAVQVMATYQLGRTLTKEQVGKLTAFLGSLAGPPPVSATGEGARK